MSTTATPHEGPTAGEPAPAFQQKIGPFDGTMLVVGTIIGSGIFLVSAEIARDVGSSGWLLAVWAVLAMYVLTRNFDVGAPIIAGLCAIAAYIVGSDAVIRLIKSSKA